MPQVSYLPRQKPILGGISNIITWAAEEFKKIQIAFKLYAESIKPEHYGLDILDADGNDSSAIVFRDSEKNDTATIIANANTNDITIENRMSGALSTIEFDFPNETSNACLVDIGRNTSSSGDVYLRLWDGQSSAWEIRARSGSGTIFGNPTGGYKGTGTINAKAVYDDNAGPLTDYVFDAVLDGDIDSRKWTHHKALRFRERQNDLDPKEYAKKWKQARKLPAFIEGEEQKSVGDIAQRLLETCEVQAIHIDKLLERIEALEAR